MQENVLVSQKSVLKYLGMMGIRSATYSQMGLGKKRSLYCTCNFLISLRLSQNKGKKTYKNIKDKLEKNANHMIEKELHPQYINNASNCIRKL